MLIETRKRILSNPVFKAARWTLPWVLLAVIVYFMAGYWTDFQRYSASVAVSASASPTVATTSTATPTSTVPAGTTATALIDGVRLRIHPTATAQVIASVGKGAMMSVLEQQKDWLKVRDPLGRIGWITSSSEFVQLTIAK
jgi:hypothetical protein